MTRFLLRALLCRTLTLALLLTLLPVAAATAEGPPRVSQMATVTQTVGLAEVAVTYSRPSMRGRKIFGELVPLDKVWRTGANEATTLTVSQDCKIGDKPLAAGTYSLFLLPAADSWTVIVNKKAEQWGASRYSEELDALRISVKPHQVAHTEQMRFDFSAVTADSASIDFSWAETGVSFEIRFDTPAIAGEQARREVGADGASEAGAFSVWADYFYKQGTNTAEALTWANAAVEASESYWSVAMQARLLARSGNKVQALAAGKKAVKMGTKALAESSNRRMQASLDELTKEVRGWAGM